MKIQLSIIVILTLTLFCGCDDDEKSVQDTVYVVLETDNYEFFESPLLSLYSYPENKIEPVSHIPLEESNRYRDGVIIADKLFTLCTDRILRRMDLHTFEIERKAPYFQKLDWFQVNDLPLMVTFQDQVLVAGTVELSSQKIACLKFYDQDLTLQDSLVLEDVDALLDIKVDNEKIYLSVVKNLQHFLLALDGKDVTPASIALGDKRCSEIVMAGDTVLAVQPEEVLLIDQSSFSVLTSIPIVARQDVEAVSVMDFFAYDHIRHVLYFLSPAVDNQQGQYSHYFLSSLNLKTGAILGITDEKEFLNPPFHFDARLQRIVVNQNGGFSAYTLEGKHSKYASGRGWMLHKLMVWQE